LTLDHTESGSESPRRVLERSAALIDAGRDKENEALLRAAASRFPDQHEVLLQAGVAVAGSAPQEAKQYLRRAAELSPSDPEVLFRCASMMFALGAFDDSRAYAHRARELADETFPLLVDLIPGRFELPRPVKVTRPSTLRTDCIIRPLAENPPVLSTAVDDLNLVDGAFVVTKLSRRSVRQPAAMPHRATRVSAPGGRPAPAL
jgi:tetratricopeptide (TPR) repeat protein